MNYILGCIFIAAGAGLLMGNKVACYVLWPEGWLWKTIFGIEVGPLYRKTQGVFFVLTGIFFFVLKPIVGSVLR